MTPLPVLSTKKLNKVKHLYLEEKLCIREVANILKVSSDAVESFIKRHKIPKKKLL
jgi:predicted DNA-binding protein YlxM (UPF0122 family)